MPCSPSTYSPSPSLWILYGPEGPVLITSMAIGTAVFFDGAAAAVIASCIPERPGALIESVPEHPPRTNAAEVARKLASLVVVMGPQRKRVVNGEELSRVRIRRRCSWIVP